MSGSRWALGDDVAKQRRDPRSPHTAVSKEALALALVKCFFARWLSFQVSKKKSKTVLFVFPFFFSFAPISDIFYRCTFYEVARTYLLHTF